VFQLPAPAYLLASVNLLVTAFCDKKPQPLTRTTYVEAGSKEWISPGGIEPKCQPGLTGFSRRPLTFQLETVKVSGVSDLTVSPENELGTG
jgi:hypothetical protein